MTRLWICVIFIFGAACQTMDSGRPDGPEAKFNFNEEQIHYINSRWGSACEQQGLKLDSPEHFRCMARNYFLEEDTQRRQRELRKSTTGIPLN